MITYSSVTNLEDIRTLWNSEVGFIYPIPTVIFNQNVVNYEPKVVFGAYEGDKLVGFLIGKTYVGEDVPAYHSIANLSLFYVSKKYRRQGIGSTLLKQFEDAYSDKEILQIGKDICNFFPGVPCDFDNLTDDFLERRGYSAGKYTHDLINKNLGNYVLRNQEFEFKVCTLAEKDALLSFMKEEFPGRWTYEVKDYFARGGTGNEYVIALSKNRVVAFTRINDRRFPFYAYNVTWFERFNNLCGVGPLGVARDMRGKDLGYDIVAYALNEAKKRGFNEILIDWTSLLIFYRQFGFEVWKSYKYMLKNRSKSIAK